MTIDGVTHAARAAVPRPRDAEPDRVRGHLSRCPRRSSTASCCASAFGYPSGDARVGDARAPARARRGRGRADAGRRPRDAARDAGRASSASTSTTRVGRYIVDARRGDARASRASPVGASPRGSLALLKLSRCRGRSRRARLRHPRRRQGDRGACARAPAAAASPSSGCSGARGEDVVREIARAGADAAGRGRRARRGVTPYASPRLVPYLGLAALGLIAALALRRAELVVVAAPFALIVAPGCSSQGRRERAARGSTLERERALEGEELVATVELERDRAGRPRSRSTSRSRRRRAGRTAQPVAHPARAGEEREISLTLRCVRWGAVELGEVSLRARDRIGLVGFEGRVRPAVPAPDLSRGPSCSAASLRRSTRRLATRRPGRPAPRGRARVRGHAPVRPRRPRAVGQLARERPSRRAGRQRAPPRAERGRRRSSSTASPRRERRRDRRDARAGRPRGRDARRPLPRAARPRRARRPSEASSAGSSPAAASCSATASSTRCSRPASSSATPGRTST